MRAFLHSIRVDRFFFLSGLVWFLVGTALAFMSSVDLHHPGAFGTGAGLTYGRVGDAEWVVFFYGGIFLAGGSVALRLFGMSGRFAMVAGAFWNVAMALYVYGILTCHMMILLIGGGGVGFAVLCLPVIFLRAASRRPILTSAGRWVVAAFFSIPLLLLFMIGFSVGHHSGVASSSGMAWYAGGFCNLCLTPLALAAFYATKKTPGPLTGIAFWTWIAVAGWTGPAILIGGPFPAWLPTVGVTAKLLLLIPVLAITADLVPTLRSASPWLVTAFCAWIALNVVGTLDAFRSVSSVVRFTYWETAESELAVYGVFALAFLGFFAPRRGTAAFWIIVVAIALSVGSLAVGGLIQGLGLLDPKVPFEAITDTSLLFLRVHSVALVLLCVGLVFYLVSFLREREPEAGS